MQLWSVNVDPKYLNFATFSKDLLATLIELGTGFLKVIEVDLCFRGLKYTTTDILHHRS
jgi:hypothetical protein